MILVLAPTVQTDDQFETKVDGPGRSKVQASLVAAFIAVC